MNGHRFRAQAVSRPWTDDDEDRLADAIADGLTFDAAGELLGRSKNSCISRFNRIRAAYGAQAA